MTTLMFQGAKPPQYQMADNKQLTLTVPKVRWTLFFCNALCSIEMFGLVVLDQRYLVLESGYDGE